MTTMTMKTFLREAVVGSFISEWKKTSDQSKQRIEMLVVEWYVKGNLSGMFDLRTPQQLWNDIFSAEDVRNFVLDTSIRLQINLRCGEYSSVIASDESAERDPHLATIQMLADCFSNPGYGPSTELDTTWFPQSGVVDNSKSWLSVSSSSIEDLLKQHSWLFTILLVLIFYEDIQQHPEFAPENKTAAIPFKKDSL